MQVPAAAVAHEVINQGGSVEQAWVAAALVSGIESNGDPTELSGGRGPAAGLFQFEPGTWLGNGGGAFAPNAQSATWQQQVTVFLHASAGNNFHDWGPDLTGTGNPNSASNPAYSYSGPPKPGSPVANKIAQLAAGGTLGFLGNVPQNWADAGAAQPGTPTPNPLVNAPSGQAGFAPMDWATALGNVLSDLLNPSWWYRIGMGALGVFLFLVGLVGFISTTKPGQKASGEIGPAVKDAAVAAVAA